MAHVYPMLFNAFGVGRRNIDDLLCRVEYTTSLSMREESRIGGEAHSACFLDLDHGV
jgi:hypothetical protein